MGDRQHADFPSEEISSRSDFTLLSCGEEPCPFSPHRGFLIPHPSPFSIQYIFKFITVLRMLPKDSHQRLENLSHNSLFRSGKDWHLQKLFIDYNFICVSGEKIQNIPKQLDRHCSF
jgi:hypothetical protein